MRKDDIFEERGRSLEEEFFRKKDAELVAKFKDVFSKDAQREEISVLTGVKDQELLDRLVNLHITGQIVTAFHLYPLIEVAWADGGIDERERDALLAALLDRGIQAGTPAYEYLERSLKEGPHPESRKAWFAYAAALKKSLTPDELTAVRTDR